MAKQPNSLFTLPNLLTSLRLILLPPFCLVLVTGAQAHSTRPAWLAFGIFAVISLSDLFDGLAARKLGLVSRFGAMLDAVADKTTLLVALVLLTTHGVWDKDGATMRLPAWVLATAIGKDLFICIGYAVMRFRAGDRRVEPDRFGKWCTAMQMVLVLAMLLWFIHPPVLGRVVTILSVAATALAIAATISYGRRGVRRLQAWREHEQERSE